MQVLSDRLSVRGAEPRERALPGRAVSMMSRRRAAVTRRRAVAFV
ncbi:hypothetical protein FM125_04380 [Micrococcus lylae]|uniref:Uncharacterized protein n=1 Tax=Micrococcus lylae TaxID=1273 RepID=A0A1R4ISV9_9MICC|nr:hypothetical protein FM125_04380 [Micrococcus lylae]